VVVRAHLGPVRHSAVPLDLSRIEGFLIMDRAKMEVVSGTGQVFTGPAEPRYCGEDQGPRACMNWVGTLHLRQTLTYQPASHFWPLQWAETASSSARR
jgi:hypothetical protein